MTASATRNGRAPKAQPQPEPEPEQAQPEQAQPEQAQPEQPEPEQPQPEPALDLAAAIAAEEIARAARVYVDVPGCGRMPTADGTLAAVQRERRADGTLGEYMLAEVRKGKAGNPDSVQRYPIARIQALKDALTSAGVTILR